jgi:hypothetical protein
MQGVQQVNEVAPRPGMSMAAGLLVQAGRLTGQAADLGSPTEVVQVSRVRVAGRGGPERGRWDQFAAGSAAVLVEVVGQLAGIPVAGAVRDTGGGAGPDRGQRPADPLGGLGGIVQRLLQPVAGQQVPVGVGQVSGHRRLQEGPGQDGVHSQAGRVHRGVNQRPGGGECVVVAVQQFRHPG